MRGYLMFLTLSAPLILGGCIDPFGDGAGSDGSDDDPIEYPSEDEVSSEGWIGRKAEIREAAAPPEQRKGHPDEIQQVGEYAFLPKRSGSTNDTWDAPVWEEGFWWEYEIRHDSGYSLCDTYGDSPNIRDLHMTQEVVDTTQVMNEDPAWSLEAYTVNTTRVCPNQPPTSLEFNHSEAHLSVIFEHPPASERLHGHIEHETLFPLEDGKQWVYVGANSRYHQVEVSYRPEFRFHGSTVEAWEVKVTFERAGQIIIETTHYGVDVGWILRQEKSQHGTVLELVDWHGDSLT